MSIRTSLTWHGRAVSEAQREAAARGLTLAAERVRSVSVSRTPLDVGDLRSSQVVIPATADDLRSSVSSDLPYAAKQHEDLSLRHRHGRAKYLESALDDEAGNVRRIIAAELRKANGGRP